MANPYSAVKVTAPGKSVFTLTHEKQMTLGIGQIIPIFRKMVMAGDKFKINSEFMLRFNPLIAPVMGRMNADIHYFYVKNTDLWSKFYEFMTGVDNLGNEFKKLNPFCVTEYEYYVMMGMYIRHREDQRRPLQKVLIDGEEYWSLAGTLLDYLGYPSLMNVNWIYNDTDLSPSMGEPLRVHLQTHYFNLFPLVSYQKIYYEYYSKEAYEDDKFSKWLDALTALYLQDGISNVFSSLIQAGQGSQFQLDFYTKIQEIFPEAYLSPSTFVFFHWLITPKFRKYANDYFTSLNPWTQKGEAPKVPITGTIDNVDFELQAMNIVESEHAVYVEGSDGHASLGDSGGTAGLFRIKNPDGSNDPNISGYFNISDLRIATAIQRLLEKFATAGTRINEYLRSVFGTSDPSLELGRALYLGGTSTPLEISTIYQNSETNTTPLGDMAGRGIGAGISPHITFKCPQHGTILGFISVRPKLVYDNVLEKELTYFDKFDYPTPDLQHVGEQAVLYEELVSPSFGYEQLPSYTLGYQQRYGEAKYIPSSRHGQIKQGHSLEYWSLFNPNEPIYSVEKLIGVNPLDYGMMFNFVGTEEGDTRSQLILHVLNKVSAKRPLSFYSTPSL